MLGKKHPVEQAGLREILLKRFVISRLHDDEGIVSVLRYCYGTAGVFYGLCEGRSILHVFDGNANGHSSSLAKRWPNYTLGRGLKTGSLWCQSRRFSLPSKSILYFFEIGSIKPYLHFLVRLGNAAVDEFWVAT